MYNGLEPMCLESYCKLLFARNQVKWESTEYPAKFC